MKAMSLPCIIDGLLIGIRKEGNDHVGTVQFVVPSWTHFFIVHFLSMHCLLGALVLLRESLDRVRRWF